MIIIKLWIKNADWQRNETIDVSTQYYLNLIFIIVYRQILCCTYVCVFVYQYLWGLDKYVTHLKR